MGPRGCTHLEQLARSLGPVVVQAVTSRRARAVATGEAEDLTVGAGSPWARDSCHIWAEGGPADQKLAAGWRPGVGPYPAPALVTFREGAPPGDPATADGRPAGHRRRHAAAGAGGRWPWPAPCSPAGAPVRGPRSPRPSPGPDRHWSRAPTYEVKVQDISGLGPVLVDGQGIALYLFETDIRGTPSRCYDICAVQWPPALSRPGCRTRSPDPASKPPCWAPHPGPTAPPRSPTTAGPSICGRPTAPLARPPVRR